LKNWFIALALMLGAYTTADAAPSAALVQMQTEMLAPTVQLDGNCSGQIISSRRTDKGVVATYILTAKHCVADMDDKEVKVQVPEFDKNLHEVSEHVYFGEVFTKGGKADLALVKLRDEKTTFTTIAKLAPLDVELYEGESTWVVGYPLGANRVMTEGTLNAGLHMDLGDGGLKDWMRASNDIAGGNSGGGIYHKSASGHYELIGTTTLGATMAPFIGVYTSISDIQTFLKNQATAEVYENLFGKGKPQPYGLNIYGAYGNN
jgi:S1-C subfamily serine protease